MSSDPHLESSRPRLLIVDDDEAFCIALDRAMSRRGFLVETAHSVHDGWRLAQIRLPDYAILDLNMPQGSGVEPIRRLRSLAVRPRILVLTGFATRDTEQEILQLDPIRLLSKPADADEITAALLAIEA